MKSLRTQMMLFFSLIILVPVILSSVNVYYALQHYLMQSYIRHQEQVGGNLAGELDGLRQKLEDLSLRIFGDRDIQAYLATPMPAPSADQLEKTTRFRQAVQKYASSEDPRVSLFLVKGQKTVYGDGYEIQRYIQLHMAAADQYGGLPVWDVWNEQGKVVLYRQINDNQTDLTRTIGYLFLFFDRSEIERTIARYTLDAGQQFGVYDREGYFSVITDASMDPERVRELGESLGGGGERELRLGDARSVAFANVRGPWTLVSWIPRELVLEPAAEMFYGILFTAVVLLIFSIFLVLFLSHRITKPLKLLQRKMKHIGEGRFAVRIPIERNDEIGELTQALNSMSDEIVSLIEKNKEEENKRRQIQLQTLEYQINPHFLYNTLDSVNMLARRHDDPVIADIVTYLSRLFRIGLNQGREMITVGDEIRHVTYYLKIQEIRFAGQLYWDIQADDSIERVKMIKFILQPLVENSINHGIRKRDEAGHIYVRAWGEPGFVVLEVEDDGVGMDAEQLERVRASLEEDAEEETDKDHGFGLRNVHQRIRLHYGPEFGLALASEKGSGTVVTVRLPDPSGDKEVREGNDDGGGTRGFH
ncbi:sensor histidine kinase [Cohnella candidum]|uniref:histidine kinase n=1 Tax=Cohnella candidum TaxID=2674991 RepID=A0A3G3JYS8_9BACL|nr:sensor histidine kinase [Cohnella candidum]AYQ73395.1 sensor histidine kinase [Cohnella candidum]